MSPGQCNKMRVKSDCLRRKIQRPHPSFETDRTKIKCLQTLISLTKMMKNYALYFATRVWGMRVGLRPESSLCMQSSQDMARQARYRYFNESHCVNISRKMY